MLLMADAQKSAI